MKHAYSLTAYDHVGFDLFSMNFPALHLYTLMQMKLVWLVHISHSFNIFKTSMFSSLKASKQFHTDLQGHTYIHTHTARCPGFDQQQLLLVTQLWGTVRTSNHWKIGVGAGFVLVLTMWTHFGHTELYAMKQHRWYPVYWVHSQGNSNNRKVLRLNLRNLVAAH